MFPKYFPWINVFLNAIFPAFPSESVRDWKFKRVYHFGQGTCNLLKTWELLNYIIFKFFIFYCTCYGKWDDEYWTPSFQTSFCLLSYYMAWAKSQPQGKQQDFCRWLLTAFITHTLGLWQPACDKDCQAAVRFPPMAKNPKGMVFPLPWQRPDLVFQLQTIPVTFWENTLAMLPFKRWKTNLSYQPAVPIFFNSASVLNFYVTCWNIFCCKTLHVVNFVTIFLEEI